MGQSIHGATRWIPCGADSLQPRHRQQAAIVRFGEEDGPVHLVTVDGQHGK